MPKVKGKYIHFTSVKYKLSKIVPDPNVCHELVMPYLPVTRPSRGDSSSSKHSASISETDESLFPHSITPKRQHVLNKCVRTCRPEPSVSLPLS